MISILLPPRRGPLRLTCALLLACLGAGACVPVAPYQRAYVNDEDMQLTQQKPATFENNFEAYREGASGANGGKIGGGCGCN